MRNDDINTIFIIPFYDKDLLGLKDAVESIRKYYDQKYKIICVNDCKESRSIDWFNENITGPDTVDFKPEYGNDWPKGTRGTLFCKKYQAFTFAVKNFQFEYLIGMDTDALMTNPELYENISARFTSSEKSVGILGSFKIRGDGKKRSRWRWALFLIYLAYIKSVMHKENFIWRKWIKKAKKNGYRLGWHALFGAYIVKYSCIKDIVNQYPYEEILRYKVYDSYVQDDVIFGLLTYASNYTIGDFSRPSDPMSIAQHYLPLKKEKIISDKKMLIHSIKAGYDGETEKELRAFFRNERT